MKGVFEEVRRYNERRIFQIKIVTFSSIFCPPYCLSWKLIQKQENVIVLSSYVIRMLTTKYLQPKKDQGNSHLQYALDYTYPRHITMFYLK